MKQFVKPYFGKATIKLSDFPLLVKFIDAKANLSVQVHPNDTYARLYENGSGKSEVWYIMDCSDNASIICGLQDSIKGKNVGDILKQGKLKEHLNYVSIHKGDLLYIPCGTVHAILGNTFLCEIQQNSDITYRIYDWDRLGKDGKPRELHIDKAIDVMDLSQHPSPIPTNAFKEGSNQLLHSPNFCIDKVVIQSSWKDASSLETFYILNVVKGAGILSYQNEEYTLSYGDSLLIPASLGDYQISGNLEILKTYLP